MFWVFERGIFQIFANFWVTNLKPFSGKVRESVRKYLNQNLVIGTFLENGFRATLSSKANFVSIWKEHFPIFCKFFSDEIEIIFWKSQAKYSELFNAKFRQKSILTKWFWSILELKNECSELLKKPFSSFFQVFEWRSRNHFLGKWGKRFKTI